ncbi:MAG: hypothetical protein IPJ66_11535 [Bacteroidetes bacterium]|nr:hypothetical protein [Bacteroidota bacterium]
MLFSIEHRHKTTPLPDLATTNALYYQGFLFKKAMLAQLGFDAHFNSAYYADAFSLQPDYFIYRNKKKTGGYPVINFFLI